MSRVDELRARYEAELAVAELEDELVAVKESGTAEERIEVKLRLREARRQFRLNREGAATAAPQVIATATTTHEAGGAV